MMFTAKYLEAFFPIPSAGQFQTFVCECDLVDRAVNMTRIPAAVHWFKDWAVDISIT